MAAGRALAASIFCCNSAFLSGSLFLLELTHQRPEFLGGLVLLGLQFLKTLLKRAFLGIEGR